MSFHTNRTLTPLVLCVAMIAALGWVSAAWGQPPAEDSTITVAPAEVVVKITSVDWIYKPTSAQMNGFLPSSVTRRNGHRTGDVVLKCRIHADTTVSECGVVDETNPEHPFGDAAVRASKMFRINPRTANGTPLDNNWVLVPLSFDVTVAGF